jgi:hypothetical protein
MMKLWLWLVWTLAAGSGMLHAEEPAEARIARWQQDLEFFGRTFPQSQKDCFVLISHDRFERDLGELTRAMPRLSDPEVLFGLMRLVASLGVAHTDVALGSAAHLLHSYPIQTEWFSDGLAVVAAAPEYRETLGCRVLQIGQQQSFLLPNSQLMIHYSTRHFHLVRNGDPPTPAPQIPAASSLEDFLAGRDPALEAALRCPMP